MPVGCDETGFIGPEDYKYRRQAWEFLLSGGAMYNHLDYSFTVGKENGTDSQPTAPGGGSPALRAQLLAMRKFIEETPYWKMRPDSTVVEGAPGVPTRAFSLPGTSYLVYGWGGGEVEIWLNLPEGRWRVDWLDPHLGKLIKTEDVKAGKAAVKLMSPTMKMDVALRAARMR
jgi:hypothetical protein